MQKILVIQTAFIGDVVLATGLLDGRFHAGATITATRRGDQVHLSASNAKPAAKTE